MTTYKIGTYAWANIKNNRIISAVIEGGNWHKFLIIGEYGPNKSQRLLLVYPPFDRFEDKLSGQDVTLCNIDPQYLGMPYVSIHIDNLIYLGKKCIRCHFEFDHLESETDFKCWKCEL